MEKGKNRKGRKVKVKKELKERIKVGEVKKK